MKTELVYKQKYLQTLSFLLLFFISGCNGIKDPVEPQNNIFNVEFGAFTQAGTSNIGTSGGSLLVKNGSSIDGLTITVPSNGLSTPRQFIVSTAELINKEIGKNLNPISPVIRIENGGGYANGIIKIKIPINLPSGHFPMGYFIDQTNNKLEPIPIIDYDATSITLGTRHFSSSTINQSSSTKNMRPKAGESFSNMIISSIAESVLNSQTIISSGFTPGVDDWEFVNFGSYISPDGHCAGQSMTSMWYFYEKKLKGGAPLNHQFDKFNTKTDPTILWQDNPLGYRLASVIQEDFKWTSWVNEMDFRSKYPSIVWKAFAAGMLVTGEPQNVLIRNSAGNGGHAMIVYKINFAEGKLYIADPNYPNNIDPSTKSSTIRTIDYVNEAFKPYNTGLSANSLRTMSMDQISYFGKTAYIDWDQIKKRWNQLYNKTIGTIAPNSFPVNSFWVNRGAGFEIKDSLNTDLDTLRLVSICLNAEIAYNNLFKGKQAIGTQIYDEQGNLLLTQDGTHQKFILLKPGVNKLGVYVFGWRANSKDQNGNYFRHFVDFKWITINYVKAAKFEYWFRSKNAAGIADGSFGDVPAEGSEITEYPGMWIGNTFVIDKTSINDGILVKIKFNATFNAEKTIMTSYKLIESFEYSTKTLIESLEGTNLPKIGSTIDFLIFGANGSSTCNYVKNVTHADFIGIQPVTGYLCDETSFIKIQIPKP